MSIADRLDGVRARIDAACAACGRDPASVELLAVSKTRTAAEVRDALRAGQRAFGENRVQELTSKAIDVRDSDVTWHMIGSVQTNKVRDLVRTKGLAMLHSLDREKLADSLQDALVAHQRSLDALLQINVSGEPSKHGVAPEDAEALLAHTLRHCGRLRVEGLMAMGPRAGDPSEAFRAATDLRRTLRARFGLPLPVLSMGMTGDLEIAIAEGSTLLRVGTGVFGPRAP